MTQTGEGFHLISALGLPALFDTPSCQTQLLHFLSRVSIVLGKSGWDSGLGGDFWRLPFGDRVKAETNKCQRSWAAIAVSFMPAGPSLFQGWIAQTMMHGA